MNKDLLAQLKEAIQRDIQVYQEANPDVVLFDTVTHSPVSYPSTQMYIEDIQKQDAQKLATQNEPIVVPQQQENIEHLINKIASAHLEKYHKRLQALTESGGGTNAVNYYNGGTIYGSLDITGNILSGGRDLTTFLGGSGGSGSDDTYVNTTVRANSANWTTAYTTVTANSGVVILNANSFDTISEASYVIPISADGKIVRFTNTTDVTAVVPAGLGPYFSCSFEQGSTGQVTFSGVNTTIRNVYNLFKTVGQYARAHVYAISANLYNLSGDLA